METSKTFDETNRRQLYIKVQDFIAYCRKQGIEFVGGNGEYYSWRKASFAELIGEMRDSGWIDDDDSDTDAIELIRFFR